MCLQSNSSNTSKSKFLYRYLCEFERGFLGEVFVVRFSMLLVSDSMFLFCVVLYMEMRVIVAFTVVV